MRQKGLSFICEKQKTHQKENPEGTPEAAWLCSKGHPLSGTIYGWRVRHDRQRDSPVSYHHHAVRTAKVYV